MLYPSSHKANDARERFIDAGIIGAILLMLAGVFALISWVGWMAYKHTPPEPPQSSVEDVREIPVRG